MANVTLKDVVSGAYLADGRIDFVLRVDFGAGPTDVPFTFDPKEKNPDVQGPLAPEIVKLAKRKKLKIAAYVAPQVADGEPE